MVDIRPCVIPTKLSHCAKASQYISLSYTQYKLKRIELFANANIMEHVLRTISHYQLNDNGLRCDWNSAKLTKLRQRLEQDNKISVASVDRLLV